MCAAIVYIIYIMYMVQGKKQLPAGLPAGSCVESGYSSITISASGAFFLTDSMPFKQPESCV